MNAHSPPSPALPEAFYADDAVTLFAGDCLEMMAQLPDGVVDMLLADLPYGTTANEWDSVIPLEAMWQQLARVVKPNGAMVFTANHPFTSQLVMSRPAWFKYAWVWAKSAKTNFLNAKIQPLRQHEDVLVFYRDQPTYNPQGVYPVQAFVPAGRTEAGNYGSQAGREAGGFFQEVGGYPSTLLEIASERETVHPTQKPVALGTYLVRTYTNPGELVLDPTVGSGTFLVAAKREGRRAIGAEIDRKHLKTAATRCQRTATGAQESLFGGTIA